MTTLGAMLARHPGAPVRGRRKRAGDVPTPPGILVGFVISAFRGDFLTESGRHVGARRRAIVAYVSYACVAAVGAAWLLTHPGQSGYRAIGGIPLASSSGIALIVALFSFLIAVDRPDVVRTCVRWGHRAALAFDYAGIALVSAFAGCGIFAALYSAHVDGVYDTRVLRADAVAFAYIASCLSIATHGAVTRPLFSVIRGRSRTPAHVVAAASRVLVIVSLFVSIAELAAPGSTTWITVAAALLLTTVGWEIAQRASADQALRRFVDRAAEAQAAAHRDDGDLLHAMASLENACSRKALGRKLIMESEVAMVIRSCLERIDPNEHRTYPKKTAMAELQVALSQLDDAVVRAEIGRLATALRQSVALHTPLFAGDIWAQPQS